MSPRARACASGPRGRRGVPVGRRLLFLDDRPAFELSFWCGTCQFLSRREAGAHETVSLPELEARLADGIGGLDEDVITAFAALLPLGDHLPMLLEVRPRLVRPLDPGDYFAHWGLTHFLLDGHPKVEAAAREGRPLRVLSLLSVDASLASRRQIGRVPRLRARERVGRAASA